MQIDVGYRITQLLVLPYIKAKPVLTERAEVFEVYWKMCILEHTFWKCLLIVPINGVDIEVLVNIEADISILS